MASSVKGKGEYAVPVCTGIDLYGEVGSPDQGMLDRRRRMLCVLHERVVQVSAAVRYQLNSGQNSSNDVKNDLFWHLLASHFTYWRRLCSKDVGEFIAIIVIRT